MEKFIGSWRLRSLTLNRPDGSAVHPLGDTPSGQIAYGPDGVMSVHLIRGGETSGDMAMSVYSGYYGAFSVKPEKGVVVHHVEGGSIPTLIDTDQEREFRFEDDKLILAADQASGRIELVWQRVAPLQG